MSLSDPTVRLVIDGQYESICRRSKPNGAYRDGQIVIDPEMLNPDWLVLFQPNTKRLVTQVPPARRMLMVGEPSALSVWSTEYVNQFGIILSPYRIEGHRGQWIQSHPGLPWFFGWNRRHQTVVSYEDLALMKPPEKLNAVSVVVSRKVIQEGHRNRLSFLDKLVNRLGDRLQIFGRGIREVDDKMDAILPYRYHLALENTIEKNYWTEKLSDAFLGFSLPLYAGCPNVDQWFARDSMVTLDLADHGRAAEQVERVLDEDIYDSRVAAIRRSRECVLENENLFAVVARAVSQMRSHSELDTAVDDVIRPIPKARWTSRLRREAYRMYHQMTVHVPAA